MLFAPGDSPKRGLDTLYQKGYIGRSVAVVAFLAKFKISNFELCGVGSQSSPSSRRVSRRRRVEARGRKPTCKIQNSKFGRGERPNFEFCFLRRRVSIVAVVASGLNRRVSIVALPTSAFSLQKSKFKIWPRMRPKFEFGLLRHRVSIIAVVASCRVVSCRVASVKNKTHFQKYVEQYF